MQENLYDKWIDEKSLKSPIKKVVYKVLKDNKLVVTRNGKKLIDEAQVYSDLIDCDGIEVQCTITFEDGVKSSQTNVHYTAHLTELAIGHKDMENWSQSPYIYFCDSSDAEITEVKS